MPDLLRLGRRAAAWPAVDPFEKFSVVNGLARDASTLDVSEYELQCLLETVIHFLLRQGKVRSVGHAATVARAQGFPRVLRWLAMLPPRGLSLFLILIHGHGLSLPPSSSSAHSAAHIFVVVVGLSILFLTLSVSSSPLGSGKCVSVCLALSVSPIVPVRNFVALLFLLEDFGTLSGPHLGSNGRVYYSSLIP
jgi:hypothetical protein